MDSESTFQRVTSIHKEISSDKWPETVQQWRAHGAIKNADGSQPMFSWGWLSMRDTFEEQGYTIFDHAGSYEFCYCLPPVGQYLHDVLYPGVYAVGTNKLDHWQRIIAMVWPAKAKNGTDVMLKLVSKGPDIPQELEILHLLSSEEFASDPENHAIPLFGELFYGDWKFIATPMMGNEPFDPWFHTMAEVIDAIQQIIEGVAFLHKHFIAHRDLAERNILMNHSEDRILPEDSPPFRSLFPVRYYLIDFEHACHYGGHDSLEECMAMPIKPFACIAAPETLSEQQYCPFPADVFALGVLFWLAFEKMGDNWGPLLDIFRMMLCTEPSKRITAASALEKVKYLRCTATESILQESVPKTPWLPQGTDELEAIRVFAEADGGRVDG